MNEEVVYAEVKKACSLGDTNEIRSLKMTFQDELDLSFGENLPLTIATERDDFEHHILAAYLLTDEKVIKFEEDNEFPCLRLALEHKSPIVQIFMTGFALAETYIPDDLQELADTLRKQERKKLSDPKLSKQDSATLVAYSGLKATKVKFRASYASAQEEEILRGSFKDRVLKFVLCG